MSNHDDNVEVIFSDGGWVGYRAFVHDPAHKGACLRSLFADYHWKPGPLQADAVPDYNNTNGFYAHKSLPEAIYQSGREDGLIFTLIEAWEVMIEGETGLRAEMAEIVAIIEPTRPKQIELFPWEDLARDYPNVPIVHQRDLRRIIAERGMVTLTKSRPSPPMQWLGQKGDLRWYREGLATNGYVMLEAASTYPGELHPSDQRLRKSYYQDLKGDRYVSWETVGQDGVSEISLMVEMSPESMYLHLDPEQPDSESQEGE
jgi:hypothetical protein